MNERVKKLTDEIRRLTPEEQADLIDELLVMAEPAPPADEDIDKAWADEIERRWQRFKSGEEPAYDAEEVLAQIRGRLVKRRTS